MKAKKVIHVTRARVTVICGGAFSCLQPLKTLTGEEIARLKRHLKRGPRMTRKGRAEYLRWLIRSRKTNER
jgi:hypothetical protein